MQLYFAKLRLICSIPLILTVSVQIELLIPTKVILLIDCYLPGLGARLVAQPALRLLLLHVLCALVNKRAGLLMKYLVLCLLLSHGAVVCCCA